MTDPRMDPASSPGQEGGGNPPGPTSGNSGGSSQRQQTRHGLFRRGGQGRQPSSSGTSAGSTATATRQTSDTSTSVPQQAGQPTQPTEARPVSGQGQYAGDRYADERYGRDYAATPGGDVIAKAAKMSWELLLLCALGMIALGICLLVWPHASLFVVTILVGASVIVSGIAKLWEGFTASDRSRGMRTGYVVIGLIAVLAGVYLLRHHNVTTFLIAFVAGVYFLVHGITDLGVAFQPGVPSRGLRAVLGIFSIAAGLVLVIWPGLSLTLLVLIVGAWLLLYGCVVAALAFGVRSEAKKMKKEPSRRSTTAAAAGTA